MIRAAALTLALSMGFGQAPASERFDCRAVDARARLVVHDFEREGGAGNLGGQPRLETRGSATISAETVPDAEGHPPSGPRGLRVAYDLGRDPGARASVAIPLAGLNATPFDRLELQLRLDAPAGASGSVLLRFLRPVDDEPERLEGGSFVVRGVGFERRCVSVPLNLMNGIRDWSHLDRLEVVLRPVAGEPSRGTLYLDDVMLVDSAAAPAPTVTDTVVPVKKRAWVARQGGEDAARSAVRKRLRALPTRAVIPRDSLPEEGGALLRRIARDTWRGIDAMVDRDTNLPVDHIRLADDRDIGGSLIVGDYTSPTNIGLYLLSVVCAQELGFIDRDAALGRVRGVLDTLDRLETYRGFYFNFYDTVSQERTSHFISFVDSSWLTAALMVVQVAYPEEARTAARLIGRTDYALLYDDVEGLMSHGYYVNIEYPSEFHYGLLYTEARVGSLIAIGKGDVPAEHWYRLNRVLPDHYTWQTQQPQGWRTETLHGVRVRLAHYSWKGIDYLPSWGGSMFEALMPALVVDEAAFAPASLGVNNDRHVTVQRRFATETLGYPVWGLSPSATLAPGGYSEFGVRELGARGYKGGLVTPHATFLAFAVDPGAAAANLQDMLDRYALYGDFGFYDAIDPESGEVAPTYLILDQAMSLIGLSNHLASNVVPRYFARHPIAARVLPMLGAEHFFD